MKKLFLLLFLMTISLGQSQNMIPNSYFDSNTTGWTFTGTGSRVGGELVFSSTSGAGNNWDTELKRSNTNGGSFLTITSGQTYTVTFRARATANRNILFQLQANGGSWGVLNAISIPITTTMTVYTRTFTAGAGGGANIEMQFHMAGTTSSGSTAGVTFDDITLVAGTATQCTNFIQDGDETGIDCGGATCSPCKINPTFGTYTVGPKVVGDAAFSATATSDSPVAITYTSGTPGVATIDANTGLVTIVGAGTTLITASQVANASYNAGSTTATLTVTLPPPPSATTPPARNAWDVVSLYSDSYTPTSGATWQAGADVLTAVGNNVRFFDGFTLARLAFAARSVTGMTTLHIDVYTKNQNQLWLEINGNRKVQSSIALNNWVSFDIPLTDYVGLNLGNVSFFDLNNPTGAAAPVKQVYLDNIYFYRAATDQPPTIGAFTVASPKTVGDADFTLTNPTSNSSGAWSYSASPAGIVTISGNTVTIVGGGTATITATQAAVTGVYGAGTASASLVVNFPAPGASPIPPVRDPGCVVSMYTGTPTTYANVVATSQASWSTGSTSSNFSFANGTNTCIQVNNLGFFGLVTSGANFSVSTMSTLHVDIYVNTPMTTMILNLLAPSDRNYSIGPLVTGWNSFDIPLTAYGTGFTNINGIKFEQSGGTARQIYIDNVYFYSGGTPTITNFNNIGKVTGDAAFSLTAPTSASPGAFTYTSSNLGVATISGSTVTLVGAGTSTITVNQAANGCFTSGTATATLTVGSNVPLAGPTAPPARNAWDVQSVFSDASYTVIPGTRNYNPGWGQAGTGAVVTAGSDNVWRASNLNYQGIVFGSNADVSAMTHFHVDVWTFNETSLQFFQISNTTGERSVALAAPYGALTLGQWVSYDIPLTAWTSQSGFTTTALKEFKIVGSGGKTVYMDNMYFYRAATAEPPTIGTFTVPGKLLGDAAFTLTAPTSNSAGAFTYSSNNSAVATVSGSTVTVVGAGSATITATQAADGSYGAGSKTAVLTVTPPAAPAQPARNAWDVVSLYSDNYTATAGAGWQNGTNVSISGNNTRFFDGFTLARLAFTPVNLTTAGMTTLHLSVYTINQNQLWFEIQGNRRVESSIALNGWVEFNIPLSVYTGLNLANISFFDLNNPTGAAAPVKVVYMDDIYFYRAATTVPPTFGAFTVATKDVGDAAFAITPPTTNSAGAITYTSSNQSVATISGSTITIVGMGTSTITASQAAEGSYGVGTTTATFTVTGPTTPVARPTTPPARNAWDVLSQYSTAYTNQAGVVFSNFNSAAVITDQTLADNSVVKKYATHTFSGIAPNGANNLDVSGMTHLHIDVWSPDFTSFKVKLEATNGSNNEIEVPFSKIRGAWNSYDIALSTYTATNLANLKWIVPVTNGNANLFITNVYFYRPASAEPPTLGTFTVPAKLLGAAPFVLSNPTSNSAGAFTYTSSNTAVATISGNTVTVIGAGNSTITATQATNGAYGTATRTAVLSVTPPAAPTPPARNAWDVISLYSNSYTTSSSASWGGVGTDVSISGNNTRLLTGSPTYRLPFTATNVSEMTTLHIDVYALNQASWQFRLNDKAVVVGTPINGWTSVDILLSAYAPQSLNLTNVSFFDFFNPLGANPNTSYVDNIYFYRAATPQVIQCGRTLRFLNEIIQCQPIAGAAQYRFEVTDEANVVRVVTSGNNTFNPAAFTFDHPTNRGFNWAKNYNIRAAIFRNNVWESYGPATCIVRTPNEPAALPTKLRSPWFCNQTVASMNTNIQCDPVHLATNYEFR
ncbi:beta strand repeat-containing protein, partial [Flavobacterium myungsuense]